MKEIEASKKSETTGATIVAFILAILVLIVVVVFLLSPGILEKIKTLLSSGNQPDGSISEALSVDQMRLLKYDYIGRVKFEKHLEDWSRDWRNHYYIYLFDIQKLTEEECKSPYEFKEACYDAYGIFSGITDSRECTKRGGKFESACFDKDGRLMKTKSEINTKLYWDWKTDSDDGDLMLAKSGFDAKIGVIKDNFFIVDENLYEKYKQEINSILWGEFIARLDGSKYVMGGIYGSSDKLPRSFG